jgi:uncharacterized membrane-anchored protein YhcB (DUF1043 family)
MTGYEMYVIVFLVGIIIGMLLNRQSGSNP